MLKISSLHFLDSTRQKDIYILLVQDKVFVYFMSEEAKERVKQHKEWLPYLNEGVNTSALRIQIEPHTRNKWFIWALSYELSVFSDEPFKIKK